MKKVRATMNIAMQAVRSEMRAKSIRPEEVSADDAECALDDLCRKEPELLASQWYANATDQQMVRFRNTWKRWVAERVSQ